MSGCGMDFRHARRSLMSVRTAVPILVVFDYL
jgi:hypothetical protein